MAYELPASGAHLELEALTDLAARMAAAGALDPAAFGDEPRSHVFTPSDCVDDEDAAAIIDVGQRDLHAKIRYWRNTLSTVITNQASGPK